MKAALEQLAAHCHGDDRPDCPIIENLAGEGAMFPASTKARRVSTESMAATARRKRTQFR